MTTETGAAGSKKRAAGLAVLSMVLAGAVVMQAWAQIGRAADGRSGMISQTGGYALMSSDAGQDDIVLVLDNRNEKVMVYRVENQSSLLLYSKLDLPRTFLDARGRNQGRP